MSDAPTVNLNGDFEIASDFFETLYAKTYDGVLVLNYIPRDDAEHRMRSEWITVANKSHMAKRACELANEADVWFGVAPRRERLTRGRGGAADCLSIPALWLDIDVEGDGHKTDQPLPLTVDEALDGLKQFPKPPSLVVSSGGGVHAYWTLYKPVPAADAPPLLSRWHETWVEIMGDMGWHIDNVSDVARILRVPGTLNHKTDPPRKVEVLTLEA